MPTRDEGRKQHSLRGFELPTIIIFIIIIVIMACLSASKAAALIDGVSFNSNVMCRRIMSGMSSPASPQVVVTRDSPYGSLVLQAARLLGPPTRFEASKLKVVFMGDEIERQPLCTTPRTYTLTHCDFTANLTLAVSNNIYIDKLRGWQTTLQRDDVVAEWKVKEEISLHVHCYVSGANLFQELAAEFRYYIFSKELPLVLKAVVHGDCVLFRDHPELMEATVWVYFHSKSKRYNRIECWGPLQDAIQRTFGERSDGGVASIVKPNKNWLVPRTIFHTLVAFLL